MPDEETLHTLILPGTYRDSAFLMKLSSQAREVSGAVQVSAMMGTPRNKELLAASGLLSPQMEKAAAQDLVVAIRSDPRLLAEARHAVMSLLKPDGSGVPAAFQRRPKSLLQAVRQQPGSSLAVISTAGDYARLEAAQALSAGLDVMLYSDNISLEDETVLKRLAAAAGKILMGPDCGTAILDNTPIGFANILPRGPVGIVASSGTGIQEASCLLGRCGLGTAAAYGTGRRDFFDAVGGLTCTAAMQRLKNDEAVKVVLVIAQAPGIKTRRMLIDQFKALSIPVIVRYLGIENYGPEDAAGITHASDIRDLVLQTAACIAPELDMSEIDFPALPVSPPMNTGFLRGIFSGGTLCQEAAEQAAAVLGRTVYTNFTMPGACRLQDPVRSDGDTFLDMGADEFTVGCPHPLLFPEKKMQRITEELCDPSVSVVVTDIVLGAGTASGQASLLARAVGQAAQITRGESRRKAVIASVTGSEQDHPSRSQEIEVLRRAGILTAGCGVLAARWAATEAAGRPA